MQKTAPQPEKLDLRERSALSGGDGPEVRVSGSAATPARPGAFVRLLKLAIKLLLPVAILFGGYSGFKYLKATKPPVAQRAKLETVWNVRAVPVRFSNEQPSLTLFGETVASRKVELRALVSGQVIGTSPSLREGAVIAAGETLLTIDPFEYEGALTDARSRLDEAKARLNELDAGRVSDENSLKQDREQLLLAERDLERAEPLVRRGTVSQKAVDDRQITVNQRRQAVEQRQSALKVQAARIAQQRAIIPRLEWGVRQAERQLAQTALKAPFNGYLSEPGAEIGRMMNVNDRVAVLLDREQIDVRFTLSDRQFGRIIANDNSLVGRDVDVFWRVGDQPLIYRAKVDRVGARISAASGGIEIFARIEDALNPVPIREGAFVEIHIADKNYERVARLPEAAVYRGDTIYVIVSDRIVARTVEIVGHDGSDVLVRGPLEAGERVVSTRLSAPAEGLLVKEFTN